MSEYRLIPLHGKHGQGKFAKVSPEDVLLVSQYGWFSHGGYAAASRQGKLLFMHRLIFNPPQGSFLDHINRDKLDNRRENLRACSHAQNMRNLPVQSGRASQYKGVKRHASGRYWRAAVTLAGVVYDLGCFKSELDAARAYDAAARFYHKDFANPNFPNETEALSCDDIRTRNEQKRLASTSSKYRGVDFRADKNIWRAVIQVKGQQIFLGYFPTDAAAALTYNEAAKKYHGSSARLNVIVSTPTPQDPYPPEPEPTP